MVDAEQRLVMCMKWGNKYGPHYVNRLYKAVRRNLNGSFRFICLTDDASGLDPQVEAFPIPSLDLPAGSPERGWHKLTAFVSDLHGLRGSALFLDLDVVVVACLDDFFTHAGPFLIVRDYKRFWRSSRRITGNSSVYRFELGAYPEVLADFRANVAQVQSRFRNEQAYLSDWMHRHGFLHYWPSAWCPSFKYHCIPTWPSNYCLAPAIPQQAKIIVFHGECNPPDALAGRRNRFMRFIRKTPWVAQHWSDKPVD